MLNRRNFLKAAASAAAISTTTTVVPTSCIDPKYVDPAIFASNKAIAARINELLADISPIIEKYCENTIQIGQFRGFRSTVALGDRDADPVE